jgi:hypothetical protein
LANFCKAYFGDLTYIHKALIENSSNYNGSPEFQDFQASPDLKKRTDSVFNEELGKVRACKTDVDYVHAIRRYLASFNDPHLHASWGPIDTSNRALIETSAGRPLHGRRTALPYEATGIELERYDEHFVIKAIDPLLVPAAADLKAGDELQSCDGLTPVQILDRDILPYQSISARESALYTYAPSIFFRWDVPVGSQTQCEFARPGSEKTRVLKKLTNLTWQEVTEDYLKKTFPDAKPSIYELEATGYGHWITLKSLAATTPEALKALKQFVQDAAQLQHDPIIVLDLRGNRGGSSQWGTAWINALFGYHLDSDRLIKESVFASILNKEHYIRLFHQMKQSGAFASPPAEKNWRAAVEAIRKAKSNQFAVTGITQASRKPGRNALKFKGKLYVLTDYNVFSSAETFTTQLKMMPGVTQAGLATNASTSFSEVLYDISPSGLPFAFPTRMQSAQPLGRKSGEPLIPELPLRFDVQAELRGQDSLRLALEQVIAQRSNHR